MESEAPEIRTAKHRRWFQFSLRSFLVFVIVAATVCGWLGKKIDHKRRERAAVADLVQRGFRIGYDFDYFAPKTDSIKVAPPPPKRPGPDWLRGLLGEDFFSDAYGASFCCRELSDNDVVNLQELSELRLVALVQTSVSPEALARLQKLPHLESLRLYMSTFVDAALPSFKAMSELRSLDFEHTNIGDEGLVSVEGMSGLRQLVLDSTRISDAGLVHLKNCTGLETLKLNRTAITDAGLVHLEGLKNLHELDVSLTLVTRTGKNRLQKALPTCSIMGDYYQFRPLNSQ